jgi:spermidine synthase
VPSNRLTAFVLLFSALIVAACGLAYELVAGALASYLLGDSVFQYSIIIGTYLFAMGIGAWLIQYIRSDPFAVFIKLELAVGILGGCSALGLFAVFVLGHAFSFALYATVFWLGVLVGAEIPLLLRLLREHFSFEDLISRVIAFDYMGALLAAILFPLVFVPHFGLVRSALAFGLINVIVAGATLWWLRKHYWSRSLAIACIFTAVVLSLIFWQAEHWSRRLEMRLYGEPVVLSVNSPYQRIAITQHGAYTSLYLNGNLQFNSKDEYRYHEALVHPVMTGLKQVHSVLVLGGGDGMAVRELLRYEKIKNITLVDLDTKITDLFSTEPKLTTLNNNALSNPRVRVINEDAWQWLDKNNNKFELILADFPDPGNYAVSRLFTTTFYRLISQHLTHDGAVVVQATSPLFARKAFWCIDNTLHEAGFNTAPYHIYVPSFGEWGFIVASKQTWQPIQPITLPLRAITNTNLTGLFQFPPDMERIPTEPNLLDHPVLVQYYDEAWRDSLQ